MNTARLRVVLRDVEPAVTRVIDVPASATLPELHELLQAAIGWTDSHLHQFVTPQATYGMDLPGQDVWPEDQRDETGAGLADLGTEFEYLYDFGDGWTHDVEVLGRGGAAPGCVDGHGTCPPEDCGGPGGYAELLDVLAAHGPLPLADLGTRVHQLLGFGWQRGGQPINADDVRMAIAQQSPRMTGLDLIDNADWRVWTAGAAARSLLPGATMLAEIWTDNE